ncbi:MAG TPA: ABC transporter permease, partial [Gemmatimonadaceae bacterium]|nr:ABC transporter permease [Gemmatimonadaceae bacterium]
GLDEPAIGHMVSIPETRRPMLNELHIRRGRWVAPGRDDEVLVSDRFAELNHLGPGDTLSAVMNGRQRRLRIVGVALSPEFVVEIAAAHAFSGNERYGVLWASRRTLESAYDMTDAFNDVCVRLLPHASEPAVIAGVDRILSPWGGPGAYGRADQPAARALADEFSQLATNATIFPVFFLVTAAFLLNVVLSRLVATQREEIAALKAFGYTDREVGMHYLGFALGAVLVGTVLGIPAGIWMGRRFTGLYADYFRFPVLRSYIEWSGAALAIGISGGFALLGALGAVRRATSLPPAEALRPEAPINFRVGKGRVGRGPGRLTPAASMALRNLVRRPLRTAAAIVGVALAVALLGAGHFPYDAFDRMLDVQFRTAQRYDVTVVFAGDRTGRAIEELRAIDGVLRVEPFRVTGVRARHGAAKRTTTITGLPADGELVRLADTKGRLYALPPTGAVLSAGLARVLGVHAGDTVTVELLQRGGAVRAVPVTGVVDEMLGQQLYMRRDALARLLHEQDAVSGAYLTVAAHAEPAVFARLDAIPGVAGAMSRRATMAHIEETISESMNFVLVLITTSAALIAIGVVYNTARIALSERGRELASLRVLGFTRGEVTAMLMGEQAATIAAALPLGVVFGLGFSALLARGFQTERYHFPFVFAPPSYVRAALIVVATAAVAGIIVHRRVGRLDLVAALRTRE